MAATLEDFDEATEVTEPYAAKWVAQQYYDAQFREYINERLRDLSGLAPGWDGYRAPPPSLEIIAAASRFAESIREHLAPRPRVVALASGAIQFEWVSPTRVLELEFESPTTIHYLRWSPTEQVDVEDVLSVEDVCRAEEMIKWFIRHDG